MYSNVDFIDDVHDQKKLNKDEVAAARRTEIEFSKKMGVYIKVHKSKVFGKKVVTTRWIDTNKGDEKILIAGRGLSEER